MKIPSKKTLISLAVIIFLIIAIVFVRSLTFRKASFYTKLNTGQDILSGIDDKRIFEIKYPKVLTKNGIRPEIENELYTGDRNKECGKDSDGNCVPLENSIMGASLSTVRKEDRKMAEKLILKYEEQGQLWRKDLSPAEASEVYRVEEIATTCYYNLTNNPNKYWDAHATRRKKVRFNHPEEYFVQMKADHKMVNIKYRDIKDAAILEFENSRENCEKFINEK